MIVVEANVIAGITFKIRPVMPDDISFIACLEAETFPGDPWSEALLNDAANHPDTVFLVACPEPGKATCSDTENDLAGYCVVRTVLEEGSIDNICVAPLYRRQHLARRLLEHAVQQAKETHGAEAFTLEVRVSNTAARALYESMGFVSEGIRPSYYAHPREDAAGIC